MMIAAAGELDRNQKKPVAAMLIDESVMQIRKAEKRPFSRMKR
ncbi:MAG: hypothetical protein R3292_07035 [Alcanivorax sp.]|nr:hypothetical protein [Alcanivorax sp.]